MSLRHEHIVDLVAAIEARLESLCPSLESIARSQATSYKDLARLIPQLNKLPAAVVVLGPIDGDEERSSQGGRPRLVDIGIMVVGEYSAEQDEGAPEHWALLDEVHDAFTPAVGRSELPGLPVAVLGAQSGPTRGTLLIPGGYRPLTEAPGRCAGVYNLVCLDTLAERTGLPVEPAEPEAPEEGVTTPADADRLTLWWYSAGTWARRFVSWANLKATLKTYFDTLYAASGANADITSLAGLTTPLSVAQGGTGAVTAAAALAALGGLAGASGATLPTGGSIVTGQIVRLTAADNTAKAPPGWYVHDGTGWLCLGWTAAYALGTLGATPVLTPIPGAAYTATVDQEVTGMTATFARPGSVQITLTNATTAAVAQPTMSGRTAKLLVSGAWDGAATALSLAVLTDDGTYLIASATEMA